MTGVAPIDDVTDAIEVSPCWRVREIRLEFGPHRCVRELSRAVGESLLRSGLIAYSIELLPVAGGHVLRAVCVVADEEPAVGEALAWLVAGDAAQKPPCPGTVSRTKPCSLAP
jgi:hypothetical protein